MKYHALMSFLEICWVGASLCIFSRQVGIWRRQARKRQNIVINSQIVTLTKKNGGV